MGNSGELWLAWRSAFAQGKICCLVNCSAFPLCQYDLREPLSFNNAENKSPLKYTHLKRAKFQPYLPSLSLRAFNLSVLQSHVRRLLIPRSLPHASQLGVISQPPTAIY